MRLATIRVPDGTRAVLADGDVARELDAPDVGSLLVASEGAPTLPLTGVEHAVDALDFAALVPAPSKIFCLGLN
jgi:acylpyruvate hydrolase